MSKYNEKGLTLVELLVSIAIVMSTITAILVLGDKALLQADIFSRNRQAIFLAQEAMEVVSDENVRTIIREDINNDASWGGVGYWRVNYTGNVSKTTTECRSLRINTSGYYYDGIVGTETPFSRCVTIWAEDSTSEMEVESKITFNYRYGENDVAVYRVFYD